MLVLEERHHGMGVQIVEMVRIRRPACASRTRPGVGTYPNAANRIVRRMQTALRDTVEEMDKMVTIVLPACTSRTRVYDFIEMVQIGRSGI